MGSRSLRRLRLAAASLAWIAAAPLAQADGPRAFVELFTSQGCSSCPPADALAGELARDPAMIVVSFNVDYWDYIGWKDTLASPANTQRQKAYAAARGDGHVYTPQMVVDGVGHVVGSNRTALDSAAQRLRGRNGALGVAMKLAETPAGARVEVAAAEAGQPKSASLWLLRVAKQKSVVIARGENAGRTIVYSNVVRGVVKLGEWSGTAQTFDIAPAQAKGPDSDAFVVVLQAGPPGKPGAVLAAAKGPGL